MLKCGSNHLPYFIRALNDINEQQEVVCYGRECMDQCIIFFNSQVFDRALCTSVLLPEGKSRDLIYLHIFTCL
jgi:hypothetical protein